MTQCPQCSRNFDECQCSTRLLQSSKPTIEQSLSAPVFEEDELTTASRIKGFKQIKTLGHGASSAVFLAEQLTLAKRVAIKRLYHTLATDQRAISRFELEARALSNLKHPNLAEIFDLGIADDGTPYIVMEYADGADLKSLIAEKGWLEPERAIQLACQLCDALAYAHDNQIIHRDLKPENIILVRDWQGKEVVKLVDFGIAKQTTQGGEIQRLTQTGELIGSPSYMSPEQIRGDEIDQRSDIYSLGCILYEVLTGRTPFRGESIMATLTLHLEQPAAPLENIKPHLASWSELSKLILKCLEKDPRSRTSSATELKDALEKLSPSLSAKKIDRRGVTALLVAIAVISIVNAAVFLSEKRSLTNSPANIAADSTQPVAGLNQYSATDQSTGMPPAVAPSSDSQTLATNSQSKTSGQNLAYELARSEVMYYSGHEQLCLENYENALNEAIRTDAPPHTVLAISIFLIESYVSDEAPIAKLDALYEKLKPKLATVSSSNSNDVDCLFGAYVLFKYAKYQGVEAQSLYKSFNSRPKSTQLFDDAIKHFNEALILAKRRQTVDADGLIGRIYQGIGSAYNAESKFYLSRQNFKQSFEWLKKSDGLSADDTTEVVLQLTTASIELHKSQQNHGKPAYLKTTREALQSVIKAKGQPKDEDETDALKELQDALKNLDAQLPD